jgi:dynein heavy chain, axonemal
MYGGHITDPWDRRVAIAYLEEYMCPELLTGCEFQPGFKSPPSDLQYDDYSKYIEEAFPVETPVLFGLHPNAEIGFLVQTGHTLFKTIIDLGGSGGGGGGEAGEDPAKATLNDLEERLPENFNMYDIAGRVVDETPYVSVVLQECTRMNKLLGDMRKTMAELQLGLAGSLNMSDSMETLLVSLRVNRVPPGWAKHAYPSLKALGNWFEDLLLRVMQLSEWSSTLETPISVWITGLFNPMAYITAILQTTARAKNLPLDQMDIWTDMLEQMDHKGLAEYAEEGMYIHGFYMEGAQWDTKKGAVTESVPKELHPAMPVVNVQGKVHGSYSMEGIYVAPVYTTSQRGPTFVFPATLKSVDKINKWVLAGVCLLMNDD